MERTMPEAPTTPQAPAVAEPTNPPAPGPAPVPTPPPAAKTPPWGDDANFTPAKAWELIENLRKEKGGDTDGLKAQVTAMQEAHTAQQARLASALGLTEPPKSEDALAETVKTLQSQFQATQLEALRLRLAASPGVDAEGRPLPAIPPEYHDLLTETDPEKLSAQAEKVRALVAANIAATATPQFQANPGQGQGGGVASPEAIAAAEYDTYFPPITRK